MLPSNKFQHVILKALYPNTQTIYPNFPNFLQFSQSHIRRIQFQSNFRIPSPVQFIHYFPYHLNWQYRRRSSAKINRIILKLRIHPNFLNQIIHISPILFFHSYKRAKITIFTLFITKWNMNIYCINIFFFYFYLFHTLFFSQVLSKNFIIFFYFVSANLFYIQKQT